MDVAKGIHQFKGISNCYIEYNNDIFLVDTGFPGNTSKIINYLEDELKGRPEDIKTIVMTHHHFDHTGSLEKLKKLTGAKVAVHSADAGYISEDKKDKTSAFMVPLVKLIKFIYRLHPVKADILLEDGDSIGKYRVVHTPGHTPGSICLYNPQSRVVFVGDNLQYAEGKIKGPGSRLIPEPIQYKESMEKLAKLDIDVILTGHGMPATSQANQLLDEYIKTI